MECWAVEYKIDNLDPKPLVMSFDTEEEAITWAGTEVMCRVQWTVDHHPYSIDEGELRDIEEMEWSLVRIWKTERVLMKEAV